MSRMSMVVGQITKMGMGVRKTIERCTERHAYKDNVKGEEHEHMSQVRAKIKVGLNVMWPHADECGVGVRARGGHHFRSSRN